MGACAPIAAAFTGISEQSGLPEPAPPAGWGYSFLDWFGAYGFATSVMAGLNYRARTGKGVWIDSSQVETGIFISGTSVLDWSANGRAWRRFGNRSPYKAAAPHGAFRVRSAGEGTPHSDPLSRVPRRTPHSEDRWIAIACFTEEEWRAL